MLTIVIPSYNHAEYIISCLDAALAVEPATTQVLVIDDGSPDNTLTVLQEYLDTHSAANRVTVIAKKNSGLVNSLLREVGGWDSNLKLDDYPMFVKLFQHSAMYDKDFAFMSNVNVVRYRQHDLNSYRDVVKQYGLVEQTLDSITPERLRAKAKGRALAFYFLVAIKSRAFGASVQILKVAGTKQSIRGILSLPYVAYLHLLRDKV